MRLIDADALIKETTEARCVNCDRRKGMKKGKMTFVYEIGEVPCRACDVMDMIDALDEAPTIGGWVSVKDRLPEESGRVLVYCKDGYMTDVNYSARHQQFNNYDVCAKQNEVWDVTHWMPLPEPPEEVSGDG